MSNEVFYEAGTNLRKDEIDAFIARCDAGIAENPEIADIADRREQVLALVSTRPFYRHGIRSEPSFVLGNL